MGATLTAALLNFTHRLRDAGVPVSMVEALDAMRALGEVDIHNRDHVRAALSATLIKRAEHTGAFEALFNAMFTASAASAERSTRLLGMHVGDQADGELEEVDTATPASVEDSGDPTDLLEMLLDALRRDDSVALQALAKLAVEQHGRVDDRPGRNASAQYYLYRILRQVDLSNLLMRALREARLVRAAGGADEAQARSDLDDRLLRDEYLRRIDTLRKSIADAVDRRLAEVRGIQANRTLHRQIPIEDVDVVGATPSQLREIRQAIRLWLDSREWPPRPGCAPHRASVALRGRSTARSGVQTTEDRPPRAVCAVRSVRLRRRIC